MDELSFLEGVALAVISTDLMTIRDIDRSEDDTPLSFEGIPSEWEIKKDMLKLHCIEGKPIELGRGGYGVVLYGTFHFLTGVDDPAERSLNQNCWQLNL